MLLDIVRERIIYEKRATLCLGTINEIHDSIIEKVGWEDRNNKEKISLVFALETLLLNWKAVFSEDTEFILRVSNRMGHVKLLLELPGTGFDPVENRYVEEEEVVEESEHSKIIFENVAVLPRYQYKKGKNLVSISLPAKPASDERKLILAVIFSIIIGVTLRCTPGSFALTLMNGFLNPLNSKLLGLIKMLAMLMVFLSIANSIGNIGSVRQLSKYGAVTMRHIMGINSLAALITLCMMPLLFPILKSGIDFDISRLQEIFEIILDIIPDNVFLPFVEGNVLQIMFLGVSTGILLLILQQETSELNRVICQMDRLVFQGINCMGRVMPVIVFISILELIISSDIQTMTKSLWMILVVAVPGLILVTLVKGYTCLKYKIPFWDNVRATFSVWLTGFLTASSIACLEANKDLCKKKYKVDDKALSFIIPTQQAFLKVASMIEQGVIPLFLLYVYGEKCSFSLYLMFCVSSYFLAIATPPVAGSSIAVMSILISKLGLPESALATYIAMSIFLDMINTSTQVSIVNNMIIAIDRDLKKL